jgi:pyrroline-5-carboxylate reductase
VVRGARSKAGPAREIATLPAAQSTFGAAKMAPKTQLSSGCLETSGQTPAGCTIDDILELEEAACE